MNQFHFLFLSAIFLGTLSGATSSANAALLGSADYGISLVGRASPYGASLDANAGYLIPIWGEAKTENLFWGYIRPAITARGIFTPTLRPSLDIYPLTFFGFSGGRNFSRQLTDQPEMDCNAAECQLEINSWYWQAKLMGKYKKLGVVLAYEHTEYDDHDHLHKPIADGINAVFLSPVNEAGFWRSMILNYEIITEINFGLHAQDFKTDISENRQRSQVLYGRYIKNQWSYTVGLGRTESTQIGVSAQGLFTIGWTGQKKIAP
ncbi:MAG: hypothetical protein AABZ31_08590 [Bdellovibrionota bacterium]|mgnify:CR=1 FL=1